MSEKNWSVYPRVEKVILTTVTRGDGKDHSDPCRTVVQVHRRDGDFIAEHDPVVNMEKLLGRLRRAESLLLEVRNKNTPQAIGAHLHERIDDFFDPEPLA